MLAMKILPYLPIMIGLLVILVIVINKVYESKRDGLGALLFIINLILFFTIIFVWNRGRDYKDKITYTEYLQPYYMTYCCQIL